MVLQTRGDVDLRTVGLRQDVPRGVERRTVIVIDDRRLRIGRRGIIFLRRRIEDRQLLGDAILRRLLALGLMTGMFWGLAGLAAWRVRQSAQASAEFLSVSLAELQRDIEALKAHQAANNESRQS